MSNEKFTTCPSDVDEDSHLLSDTSSSCDEVRGSEDVKDRIIDKVVDWVCSQPWWVILIFVIVGTVIGLVIYLCV